MKITLAVILFLFLSIQSSFATKITSKVCGEWSDSTTWDLNRPPLPSDTIIVNSFVAFNTDFASASPGMLYVSLCGTLCGTASYTGCFTFDGIVFAKTLTLIYGHSVSNNTINVQSSIIVKPPASFAVTNSTTCVGCTSPCKNCNIYARSVPCDPVSLTELLLKNKIHVFPNPAINELNISGIKQETIIGFYDMIGNLIQSITVQENCRLDLRFFHDGIYLLMANTSAGISIHKIIVSR